MSELLQGIVNDFKMAFPFFLAGSSWQIAASPEFVLSSPLSCKARFFLGIFCIFRPCLFSEMVMAHLCYRVNWICSSQHKRESHILEKSLCSVSDGIEICRLVVFSLERVFFSSLWTSVDLVVQIQQQTLCFLKAKKRVPKLPVKANDGDRICIFVLPSKQADSSNNGGFEKRCSRIPLPRAGTAATTRRPIWDKHPGKFLWRKKKKKKRTTHFGFQLDLVLVLAVVRVVTLRKRDRGREKVQRDFRKKERKKM